MKISYDDTCFSMQRFGGVSRYFSELIQRIAHENEVHINGGISQSYYLEVNEDLKKLYKGKVVNRALPQYTNRLVRYPNQLIGYLQSFRDKSDVFHETYYSTIPTNLNKSCLKVTTVYDMIHEIYPKLFRDSRLLTNAKRKSVDRADVVLAISQSTKNDLIDLFNIDPSKVIVSPLGYTLNLSDFTYAHAKPYILIVGARSGYKNFQFFLNALRHVKQEHEIDVICFGGPAFSACENKIISEIESMRKTKIIYKNGSDELLHGLYRGCEFMVFPSYYEGFGFPPLYAIAHRKLPIVCNRSSMPEVTLKFGLYFDYQDNDSLVYAIEQAIANPRIRGEENEIQAHLNKYSWQRCAEVTLEAYRK